MSVVERFARLTHRVDTPCRMWLGGTTGNGDYGVFSHSVDGEKRTTLAHRWAYEQFVGLIPDGMTVDHLCLVTRCVNTDHMELVTVAENLRRRHARTTHCRNGHERTPENRLPIKGGTECAVCRQERAARYRVARQAVAS